MTKEDDQDITGGVGLDAVLTTLGFGKWTMVMFAMYLCWTLHIPYFALGGAFFNPSVDYHCNVDKLLPSTNWSLEQKLNFSIPWERHGDQLKRSECFQFDRNSSDLYDVPWENDAEIITYENQYSIISCTDWTYDNSTFHSTFTTEFNLVCDDANQNLLFQTLYFIGWVVGDPVMGALADIYGRRFVLRAAVILSAFVSISTSFLPYYSLVLMFRFFIGFLHSAIGIGFVHAMETCPPKYRTIAGISLYTPSALSGMMFGVFAYLIRDWRKLHLICSIFSLFGVCLVPFMDESPRWQILHNQEEKAIKTLKKAARWHHVDLTKQDLQQCIKVECVNRKNEKSPMLKKLRNNVEGTFTLVRTPVLRRITLILFCIWFLTTMTFWGLNLSGTTFSSSPFLFILFCSLVEIPSVCLFVPLVSKFGRKKVLSTAYAIFSFFILATIVVPRDSDWLIFTLAMIGKLVLTGCYNTLILFSSELFPTSVRARGYNFCSMMGMIGSILSPLVFKVSANIYWLTPCVVFGSAALISSIAILFLPETKGRLLPETIEQVETNFIEEMQQSHELTIAKNKTTQKKNNKSQSSFLHK